MPGIPLVQVLGKQETKRGFCPKRMLATSSQVLLLTTALKPIFLHRASLWIRNWGKQLIQSSPMAQGKISYFSSSSSSSMSLARYLHNAHRVQAVTASAVNHVISCMADCTTWCWWERGIYGGVNRLKWNRRESLKGYSLTKELWTMFSFHAFRGF